MKTKQKPDKALADNLKQETLFSFIDMCGANSLTKKATALCKVANMFMDDVGKDMVNKYCVMNNIGCGEVSSARFEITDTGCLMNDDYNDPDECSYILYMLAAKKFNDRLSSENAPKRIKRFEVATRGDKGVKVYQFCLKAYYDDDKSILLGGDWIFNWRMLSSYSQEEARELILKTHTIKNHVFWPCEKHQNKGQTINQARTSIGGNSFEHTLKLLKICMDNKFDEEKLERFFGDRIKKGEKNLILTLCEYKDWFEMFGSYKDYVDFWDISLGMTKIIQ